jgi:caffeic acid 3-O-methyltransferase
MRLNLPQLKMWCLLYILHN